MSRRPAHRQRPSYTTLAQVQAGAHYAMHVDQGEPNGPHYPLALVDAEEMDRLHGSTGPDEARGVPTHYAYVTGSLRVWPAPADGFRVFSEVSGKDVTP